MATFYTPPPDINTTLGNLVRWIAEAAQLKIVFTIEDWQGNTSTVTINRLPQHLQPTNPAPAGTTE